MRFIVSHTSTDSNSMDSSFWRYKVSADVLGILGDVALYVHVVVITETTDQPTTRVISAVADVFHVVVRRTMTPVTARHEVDLSTSLGTLWFRT